MKILNALALRALLFAFFLAIALLSIVAPGYGNRLLDEANRGRIKMPRRP